MNSFMFLFMYFVAKLMTLSTMMMMMMLTVLQVRWSASTDCRFPFWIPCGLHRPWPDTDYQEALRLRRQSSIHQVYVSVENRCKSVLHHYGKYLPYNCTLLAGPK